MTQASSPPAQEKGQQVVSQAGEKAQEVAGDARDKLREQLDQRSSQAGEKVTDTAEDLRSVGEELRKQGKDTPARLADQAADRTERLGSYLTESDADKMLADVEDFGRRQPLAVLAGGLALGIAAARFLKASSRDRYQSRLTPEEPTRELGAAPLTPSPTREPQPIGAGEPWQPAPSDPVPGR
ncbi:MAG TPA: hypothetical protein VNM89_03505 [Solirubrobacterales bacterium]|nr:hypothetical protein [Solirubrobacterales bacterium]